MTCEEAEVLLHALIDGELDAGHAREVEAHVAGCAKCAALAKDFRAMRAAINEAGASYRAPLELRRRMCAVRHSAWPGWRRCWDGSGWCATRRSARR